MATTKSTRAKRAASPATKRTTRAKAPAATAAAPPPDPPKPGPDRVRPTTAERLVAYRQELLEAGLPNDLTDDILRDAAHGLIRGEVQIEVSSDG